MDKLTSTIRQVLENNSGKCLDNEEERNVIANAIANKLTSASLQQLADLLGGSVEYDNYGQAVIYTNVDCETS
jgi:hypothetical protein